MFDTQIAHRLLNDALRQKGAKNEFKHNNIGLNELLMNYAGQTNECKEKIQSEMKSNRYFWETRPLTESMLKYASQDVIFLPTIYATFVHSCDEIGVKRASEGKSFDFQITDVFYNAMKCNDYAMINRSVEKLKNGDRIQAFVKNIQTFGTFCSLNLGITGFINHKRSKKYIMAHHQIGDVVDVFIDSIQKKNNRVLLKLASCADSNNDYYDDQDVPYEGYYDDFGINERYYAEPPINEYSDEYNDSYNLYDPSYDMSQMEPPNTLSHSMSHDRLIGMPEISMYYPDAKQYSSMQLSSGELGYNPYQSDFHNTTSTTYSFQNLRK